MAKGQFHSGHQRGIIKRYYEHKDDLSQQKLGEIVSDLYLETDPAKAGRLWTAAQTALLAKGANKLLVQRIFDAKNLEGLAELVGELY